MLKKALCVLFAVACISAAHAGVTLTTTATSDGMSRRDQDNSWGVVVYESTGNLNDAVLNGENDRSYPYYWSYIPVLEFDMSPYTDTAEMITSAVLNVYLPNSGAGTVSVLYNGDADGIIDFDSRNGSTIASFNSSATSGWYTLDVTNKIKEAVNNAADFVGFVFQPGTYGSVSVAAYESGDTAPFISVVPEPATLALLGIGGLAAMRRKKTA